MNSDPTSKTPELRGNSLRLLAVDDNALNLEILYEFFTETGANLDTAQDAKSALNFLRQYHYDAILMDINMPVTSGIELTRIIKDLDNPNSSIPIIGLSANDKVTLLQHCTDAGMSDLLEKPIDFDSLLHKLDQLGVNSAASQKPQQKSIPTLINPDDFSAIDLTDALNRFNGNITTYCEFIGNFKKEYAEFQDQMMSRCSRDDMEYVMASLHKLKGLSSNLSFRCVARVSREIEVQSELSQTCPSQIQLGNLFTKLNDALKESDQLLRLVADHQFHVKSNFSIELVPILNKIRATIDRDLIETRDQIRQLRHYTFHSRQQGYVDAINRYFNAIDPENVKIQIDKLIRDIEEHHG